MIPTPYTPKFDVKSLVTRPEVLTLVLAIVISIVAASGLPERAGLAVPEAALGQIITSFWTVFLGALCEGKLKGVDYAGGLKALVGSFKMRAALVQLLVVVVAGLSRPLGIVLPDEVLVQLGTFVVYAILGKTALDGYQAVSSRPQ